METPLAHLLTMPDDIGAYEPHIERAPLSHLMHQARNDREDLQARVKTTATLLQHGMEASIDEEEESTATQQFNRIIQQLPLQTNTLNKPGIVLKLAAMMGEYDHEVVRDAAQMRQYVTNRLLEESEATKPGPTRMRALQLLGTITEVGLFTERTEVTVKTMPMESLEARLHDKLRMLLPAEYNAIVHEQDQERPDGNA